MEPESNSAPTVPIAAADDQIRRIIGALPAALVLTEPGGLIEFANPPAEQLFGYNSGELRCSPLQRLFPKRFRTRLDLRQLVATATSLPMNVNKVNKEVRFGLRKDGREFPLQIDLRPVDLDEKPRLLASIVDLTKRVAMEAEKSQKQRELERSNAELEGFAYAASHDLKAPLRAITHLVQWISEDVEATAKPDTVKNLRLLQGRVQGLQLLLDGMLTYARIAHPSEAVAEDLDITEVVHDIVSLRGLPAGFVVACEAPMPIFRTQRTPIQVVLDNLIGNGLKHHDRSEGRITVTMGKAAGVAEFRVSDDGPGVPVQFHDRIFTLFQTLARRDDSEPGGIGLAIVKKKVEHHGGEIWVESNPPARGATFAFTWREAAP